MTSMRFSWQHQKAGEVSGTVLNVGCKEDPAHLKASYGDRVINCDIAEVDHNTGETIVADILFDCTKSWPFEDNSADLVIFGDILEHLLEEGISAALTEARRVSSKVAITVPKDDRPETLDYQANVYDPAHPLKQENHLTVVTEPLLRRLLDDTGWNVTEWQTVDYTFVPEGYFVLAERG